MDGSAIDINNLNTTAAKGANIQFLNENQGVAEYFSWYTPETFGTDIGKCGPSGKRVFPANGMNGVWFRRDYDWTTGSLTNEVLATRAIAFGEAFLFYTTQANKILTFTGAVEGDEYVKTTISGVNMIGNPFPANIDVNNINTTVAKGANIQFLNENQGVSEYYSWYTPETFGTDIGKCGPAGKRVLPADGMKGVWFRRDYDWTTGSLTNEVFATRAIKGGEAFIFYTTQANKQISVKAPYSL